MPTTAAAARWPPPPSTARRGPTASALLEQALNLKTPGHLRHDPARRPRGAGRQPGGDAGRPREAEADQGALPLLGVRRPRPHRAAGAHLQRHLQQPAAPAVRRLAPRLPRHEPGHQAAPAPEGCRLAGHEQRQHAAGPRRRGGQDLHDGRHRHEDEAGRADQEADVRGAQPHAGAVRPRVHAALPQRQAADRHARRTSPATAASC